MTDEKNKEDDTSFDQLGTADEGDWASAVDAWDEAVAVVAGDEDEGGGGEQVVPPDQDVNPLRALDGASVDELDEAAGEALGSLLSGPALAGERGLVGENADAHFATSATEGVDPAEGPFGGSSDAASLLSDEIDQLLDHALMGAEETKVFSADDGHGSDKGNEGSALAKIGLRKARVGRPVAATAPTEKSRLEPPPLELFDAIVPPASDSNRIGERGVVAGDVLPEAQTKEIAAGRGALWDLGADVVLDKALDVAELAPELLEVHDVIAAADAGQAVSDSSRSGAAADNAPSWETWGRSFLDRAEASTSSARAAELAWLAGVGHESAADNDSAAEAYSTALGYLPGYLPALMALRRISRQRGQHAETIEVLRSLLERLPEGKRDALRSVVAERLWLVNDDRAGASELLQQLDESSSQGIRRELIRLDLSSRGRADDGATRVEALRLLANRTANSALTLAWGRAEELRQDWDAALRAYNDASDLNADLGGAWEGALRVAEKLGNSEAIAKALAGSATALGTWGARRQRRLGTLVRFASISGVNALEALQVAVEAESEDPLAVENLAEELLATEAWEQAATTLRRLSELVADDEERASLLVRAAELYRWRLDNKDVAGQLYLEARALAEDFQPGLEGVLWWDSESGDEEARLSAFRGRSREREGAFAAASDLVCARILETQLELKDDAIAVLEGALKKDSGCIAAADSLARLGSLAPVVASLRHRAGTCTDGRVLYGVAAEWSEGKLRDTEQAARCFENAVGDSVADIGRLRVLRAVGRDDDLLNEFGRQAEVAEEKRASRWWWTLRGYHQFAEAPSQAESSFRLGLSTDDEDCGASMGLALLYGRQGRLREVQELWAAQGKQASNRQRAARDYRLGALEEFLSSPKAARRYYRSASEHFAGWRWLADEEERLLLGSGDFDAIAAHVGLGLEGDLDGAQRLALMFLLWDARRQQAKDLSPQDDDYAGGFSAHAFALANAWQNHFRKSPEELLDWITEGEGPAFESLVGGSALELAFQSRDFKRVVEESERLIAKGGQSEGWPLFLSHTRLSDGLGLAEALFKFAEGQGPDIAAQLFKAAGRSYERADNGDGAAKAYRAALDLGAYAGHGLRFLVDRATERGERQDLAQLYRRLALTCENERDASIFWTRTGELSGDQEAYQTAITAFDGQIAAIIRMQDEAMLAERWPDLYTACEAAARACRRPENRQRFLRLASRVAEEKLGDPGQAIDLLKRLQQGNLLELFDCARLTRLLREEKRFDELAQLLEYWLESRAAIRDRRDLHLRLATVYQDELKDLRSAKVHLRAVLDFDPEDVAGWARLGLLYEADGEWAEAADAIIRQAQQESDAAILGQLFWRLGTIYQERTPDLKRAVASFNKVLILDPDHQDALARISRLFILDHDYEQALSTTAQLFELEDEPQKKIEHLLRMAKIHEEGFKDSQQAALTFRRAMELSPHSLPVIEALADYYSRQSDQRSLIVHLDGAISSMRARIERDAFDMEAIGALYRLFGKRGVAEGQKNAAQILELLGSQDEGLRKFLRGCRNDESEIVVEDAVVDEYVHHRSIPGGFKQIFRLLAPSLRKLYPTSLRQLELSRSDRITDGKVLSIAESVAGSLGVVQFEIYQSQREGTRLSVENTAPPTIIIGRDLLKHAGAAELRFIFGRVFWLIRSAMVLPACMDAPSLLLLVGGIIRQYAADFTPADCDPEDLKRTTKELRSSRVIPKKLKQELMPYVLECAGSDVDLAALGATITHSANRAGLLFADALPASLSVLALHGRMEGQTESEHGAKLLESRGNLQVEELIRFALSEEYFNLSRMVAAP